jgi:hypothetical protein
MAEMPKPVGGTVHTVDHPGSGGTGTWNPAPSPRLIAVIGQESLGNTGTPCEVVGSRLMGSPLPERPVQKRRYKWQGLPMPGTRGSGARSAAALPRAFQRPAEVIVQQPAYATGGGTVTRHEAGVVAARPQRLRRVPVRHVPIGVLQRNLRETVADRHAAACRIELSALFRSPRALRCFDNPPLAR